MSSNVEMNDDQFEELINSGGLKKATTEKRNKVLTKFKTYIAQNSDEAYEEIILDKAKIQKAMIMYLETLRVTKKGTDDALRPKSLYFQTTLSHLKMALGKETGFDFSNKVDFEQLYKGVSATKRNIKADGRGNVKHTRPIPPDTLLAIFGLLANVQALMESRRNQDQAQYQTNLKSIPEKYR